LFFLLHFLTRILKLVGWKYGFIVVAAVLGSAVAVSSESPSTPAQYLVTIPQPPRFLAEVMKRCVEDHDTSCTRAHAEIDQLKNAAHVSLTDDSLRSAHTRRNFTQREKHVLDSLQTEIKSLTASITDSLTQLTTTSSQDLLAEVRSIGELLDREIKGCALPDSECVNRAEHRARLHRVDAVHRYLQALRHRWVSFFAETTRRLTTCDKRIEALRASSKSAHFTLELKRLQYRMWNIVDEIVSAVGQMTCLAAQFGK